jgi:hypothetical protein
LAYIEFPLFLWGRQLDSEAPDAANVSAEFRCCDSTQVPPSRTGLDFRLLLPDRRGDLLSSFAVVRVTNIYMSFFVRRDWTSRSNARKIAATEADVNWKTKGEPEPVTQALER